MKFARYLEETQVPEWKKAYIDYRGIKKRITACRKEVERANSKRPASPHMDAHVVTTHSQATRELQPDHSSTHGIEDEITLQSDERKQSPKSPEEPNSPIQVPPPAVLHEYPNMANQNNEPGASMSHAGQPTGGTTGGPTGGPTRSRVPSTVSSNSAPHPPEVQRSVTLNMGMLPRLRSRRSTFRVPTSLRRGGTSGWELTRGQGWDPAKPIALVDLMPLLTATQKAFFQKLDTELDKVEAFYVEREKEMLARATALKAQLNELQAHRKEYYDAQKSSSWMNFSLMRPRGATTLTDNYHTPGGPARKRRPYRSEGSRSPEMSSQTNVNKAIEATVETNDNTASSSDPDSPTAYSGTGAASAENGDGVGFGKKLRRSVQKRAGSSQHPLDSPKHDPEEYYHAKKKLKKAVLECYRGLEILNNYRTLNLIGFRKGLKKFEKVTKIPAQQAYTTERIEPNAFSSPTIVEAMIRDMEELFAARFTRGDKKKALARLRGGVQNKSHHFSTFRSGMLLGLAVPAFVDGLVLSFQKDTREAIPAWDGLLYVYAILVVPVVFALLVGLNLQVWSTSRINYVFIFELELRTKLDHRQYYELPTFLLCTLCYAFWLSFKRIGENSFSPTIWPLLWLALAALFILNPFPIYFKRSRYWLLRNVSKLLISGTRRVEFTDFWMGDQFCSMIFTLSNIYFIPCAYSGGLDRDWQRCTTKTSNWGVLFVLGTLPLLARAVQSVKRWYDSRLPTHLINGGKYTTGILYYLCYFIWRHGGGGRGGSFVAWCILGTLYSTYAAAWDLLIDWSLLRRRAKHPLLRNDILYTNAVPVYYFAVITNVLIRFIWVFYIPEQGPNFLLRTFIAAILEALRRWQWNFFRLENEHLGNVDQYRVTREVPLPYTIYDGGDDSDDEDVRSHKSKSSMRWRRVKNTPVQPDSSDPTSSD